MQASSISPIYVRNILKGAETLGHRLEDIIQEHGLSNKILNNPKLRISTLEFAQLCRTLSQLTQDEAYGLLAKPQALGTFETLARASFSADTVPIHRFHCWQAKEFIPVERVDLSFAEPSFSDEYRYIFYDAKIHFDQKQNAIYFNQHSLGLSCRRSHEDLKDLLQNPQIRMLNQAGISKSISIKIRIWMEKLFRDHGGTPLLSEAAKHLDMSTQTVRRHLIAEGYTFQKIKDDARRDMSIHLIAVKEQSIESIAFQLGFSESSTFIRAFKKWTGLTPLEYRKL